MEIKEPRAIDQHRRYLVETVVINTLGDDHPRHSDLSQLLDRATREAADQAVALGRFPVKSDDYRQNSNFDEDLVKAIAPIEALYWSLPRADDDNSGTVWSHRHHLLQDAKASRLPEFQRREIEQIAGDYLKGGARTQTVDRLLVDLLIAMEFAQYSQTVLHAAHVPFLAPSVMKRRVVFEWFGGRIIAAVLGYVGYLAFWGLEKVGLFPDRWLWIVGLILAGLWVLDAVWSTVMLPKVWLDTRRAKKKVLGLLDEMYGTYAALASDGPVSAQHVIGLVDRSTTAGVVWPGPLHVLLEDIIARGGRF